MKIIEEITDLFDWIKNRKEYQQDLATSEIAYTYQLKRAGGLGSKIEKLKLDINKITDEYDGLKEKYNRLRRKYKNIGGK